MEIRAAAVDRAGTGGQLPILAVLDAGQLVVDVHIGPAGGDVLDEVLRIVLYQWIVA